MDPSADSTRSIDEQIADFGPRLYAFAYTLTRDREDAADLAQETSARAIHHSAQFLPGTNLKAWLFTILRNLHLNQRRSSGSRPKIVALEELAAERAAYDAPLRPVEQEVVSRSEVADVAAALQSIPPAFAAPLRLVAVEQLTYSEAAAVLDLPLGTVMSRIYRARRMLIARLEATES